MEYKDTGRQRAVMCGKDEGRNTQTHTHLVTTVCNNSWGGPAGRHFLEMKH